MRPRRTYISHLFRPQSSLLCLLASSFVWLRGTKRLIRHRSVTLFVSCRHSYTLFSAFFTQRYAPNRSSGSNTAQSQPISNKPLPATGARCVTKLCRYAEYPREAPPQRAIPRRLYTFCPQLAKHDRAHPGQRLPRRLLLYRNPG